MWISAQGIADEFNVHRSTVSRWARDGKLKATNIGGFRLFRRSDVRRLARARRAWKGAKRLDKT